MIHNQQLLADLIHNQQLLAKFYEVNLDKRFQIMINQKIELNKNQIEDIKDHILTYPITWEQPEVGGYIMRNDIIKPVENVSPENTYWKNNDGTIFYHKTYNPDYSLIKDVKMLYHSHPIPMNEGDFLSSQDILWADQYKKPIIMYHPYKDKLELYNPKYPDIVKQLEKTNNPDNTIIKQLKDYQIPKNNIKRFNKKTKSNMNTDGNDNSFLFDFEEQKEEKKRKENSKKNFYFSKTDYLKNQQEVIQGKYKNDEQKRTRKQINEEKPEGFLNKLVNRFKGINREENNTNQNSSNDIQRGDSRKQKNLFDTQEKHQKNNPLFEHKKNNNGLTEANNQLFDYEKDTNYVKKPGLIDESAYTKYDDLYLDRDEYEEELMSNPNPQWKQQVIFYCGIGDYSSRIAHLRQDIERKKKVHLNNIATANHEYDQKKQEIVKELLDQKLATKNIDNQAIHLFRELNTTNNYRDIMSSSNQKPKRLGNIQGVNVNPMSKKDNLNVNNPNTNNQGNDSNSIKKKKLSDLI